MIDFTWWIAVWDEVEQSQSQYNRAITKVLPTLIGPVVLVKCAPIFSPRSRVIEAVPFLLYSYFMFFRFKQWFCAFCLSSWIDIKFEIKGFSPMLGSMLEKRDLETSSNQFFCELVFFLGRPHSRKLGFASKIGFTFWQPAMNFGKIILEFQLTKSSFCSA